MALLNLHCSNVRDDMRFQFMRIGYFIKDSKSDSYNCTVGLKDSYKPEKPANS